MSEADKASGKQQKGGLFIRNFFETNVPIGKICGSVVGVFVAGPRATPLHPIQGGGFGILSYVT